MEIKSKTKVFGGQLIRFSHQSTSTGTTMTCAVFLPANADTANTVPYLLYLSGLTCTDENVCQKSGIFRYLAQHQVCELLVERKHFAHLRGVSNS
jgi:S-formylglutathione hydrolase